MNVVNEAAKLAWSLHSDQTRAGGESFIYHPMRVAGLLSIFGDNDMDVRLTDDMIAAAWLHDVYEDTTLDSPMLNCINPVVERLVDELTNRFTKAEYPKMNRDERKAAERERIADISPEAQTIKLCDRLDNLSTITSKRDRKFHLRYCEESYAMVDMIVVNPFLKAKLFTLISQIRKEQ